MNSLGLTRALLVLGGTLSVPALAAQEPARAASPALSVEFTNWQMDMGAFSSGNAAPALQGVTGRLALRIPGIRLPRGLAEVATFRVSGDDMSLTGAHLGYSYMIPVPWLGRGAQLLLSAGAGAFYLEASAREQNIAGCSIAVGCMFEGFSYRTGAYPSAHTGLALLFPLSHRVGLRTGLDLVKSFGEGAGDVPACRLGLAATWKIR